MIFDKKEGLTNKELLIKNTFWLSSIEFFSKILLFLITISLVRYWGSEEFGAYNLSFAYVAMFTVLGDFGLTTIATREVAKHKDLSEKYLSNLMGLKLALSVIIVLLFVFSFLFFNKPVSIYLLTATLVYCLTQIYNGVFVAIFQAWERMELVFWNKITYYVGMLIIALLIIRFHGNAIHLVLGYTIVTILASILGIWQSGLLKIKFKIAFDYIFWKELIIESLPLFGMVVATVVYVNNDTLLIGRYFGTNQVGWYQTAYKILFAFQSINVINYAVFPRLTVLFNEKQEDTSKKLIELVIGLSIFGLIPLATVITWQRELIMKLIYGQSFVVAADVMSLLIWSGVINYFRVFVGNLLIIKKRQKILFGVVLLGTLLDVTINYFFIPKFGFIQAGRSLIISELVMLFTMLIGYKIK